MSSPPAETTDGFVQAGPPEESPTRRSQGACEEANVGEDAGAIFADVGEASERGCRIPHFCGEEIVAGDSAVPMGITTEARCGRDSAEPGASETASSTTVASSAAQVDAQQTNGLSGPGNARASDNDIEEYHSFCFPIPLDHKSLEARAEEGDDSSDEEDEESDDEEEEEEEEDDEDSSSLEDEDTDAVVDRQPGVVDKLQQTCNDLKDKVMNAEMFSDPAEREKWKNRGWRAAQCCGGTLLVLALIFDELD